LRINDCNAIIDGMASLTLRNLDDETKARLRLRAARHQVSMEAEARTILKEALATAEAPTSLVASIRKRIAAVGGVELELPERGPMRAPPRFGK
jgi:antitoxin FitA